MRDTPTFGDALIFRAKATLLQLKRAAQNRRRNGTTRSCSRITCGSRARCDCVLELRGSAVQVGIGIRLEAMMDANLLIVRFRSNTKHGSSQKTIRINADSSAPQSCVTCDAYDCFRHVERRATAFGRSAFLVDEYYPEFDNYILETRRENDLLAIPLDGKKYGKANYAWTTGGFRHVRQSAMVTLLRAYQSRKLAAQGAARQRALLGYSERLATSYSRLNRDRETAHVTMVLL